MKRLAPVLVLLLAVLTLAPPAEAGPEAGRGHGHRILWLGGTWYRGVQMATSYPTVDDPYLHAKFKRVAGQGQRQVRMGERWKRSGSHRYTRYHYTDPVLLAVGEKVVFTTEHALPCEPAVSPVGITVDMRVKLPGERWSEWVTWIGDDQRLLDCEEDLP